NGAWRFYTFNEQEYATFYPTAIANGIVTLDYNSSNSVSRSRINNIEANSATITGTGLSTLPTLLGARHNASNGTTWTFFYPGSLRRVLIWIRLLSEFEMTAVYNYLTI